MVHIEIFNLLISLFFQFITAQPLNMPTTPQRPTVPASTNAPGRVHGPPSVLPPTVQQLVYPRKLNFPASQ